MKIVKKDGKTQVLHSEVQVAAFKANGWVVEEPPTAEVPVVPEDPTTAEVPVVPEEATTAEVPVVPEETTTAEVAVDEVMSALRAEADALEIKYHPNIGAEKLRKKIAEAKGEESP